MAKRDKKGDKKGDKKEDNKGDKKEDNKGDKKEDNKGDKKEDNKGDKKEDNKGDKKEDNKGDKKADKKGDKKELDDRDDDDYYTYSDEDSEVETTQVEARKPSSKSVRPPSTSDSRLQGVSVPTFTEVTSRSRTPTVNEKQPRKGAKVLTQWAAAYARTESQNQKPLTPLTQLTRLAAPPAPDSEPVSVARASDVMGIWAARRAGSMSSSTRRSQTPSQTTVTGSVATSTGSGAASAVARAPSERTLVPCLSSLLPMYPGRRPLAAGSGTRVELHAHLEGSIRVETIWELMKVKNMGLPDDGSVRALRDVLVSRSPISWPHYGQPIPLYLQAFMDDKRALERVAYEFCEDKVHQGLLYVEARYVPHRFIPNKKKNKTLQDVGEVVWAVTRGFRNAEMELGITVRSVLSIVVGTGNSADIIALCKQFRNDGVVGIDLMLPYDGYKDGPHWMSQFDEVPLTQDEMRAFQEAEEEGIHRTIHAGYTGTAYMVQRALEKYRAQRLGHGYEVLKLPPLYEKCRLQRVHFECCPWVSFLSGAVDTSVLKHPIAQFAEDGANFGLNSSDTVITGVTLQEEYDLATSWGLTEAHIVRSNINSLRSSFLPEGHKAALMQRLLENLGIQKRTGVSVLKRTTRGMQWTPPPSPVPVLRR